MPEPPSLPPPVVVPSWPDRLRGVAAALGLNPAAARWAAAGLALLLVAVVVWFAVGQRSQPAELSLPRAGSAADPGASASTSATSAAGAEATAHAAGAVGRPGVYRLRPGARVTDLLDAAGGPVADADLDQLNLAAPVADGERVYVPRRGEVAPPVAGAGAGPGGDGRAGPVDLNRATADQLDGLPGVGPATAKAILDYRQQHGRFRSVEELLEVRGIGPAKLDQLRSLVKV